MIDLLMGAAAVVLQQIVVVGADGAGDGFSHRLGILFSNSKSIKLDFNSFFFFY